MTIIGERECQFFKENGYIKLSQIIPKEMCDQVIAAIWECLNMDPNDKESWYHPPKGVLSSAGMVEMYHHPSMWAIRQHPDLYQAFAELLGEEQLWVTLDRVNMTPPSREDHPELDYGFIHWDTDTSNLPSPLPHPYGVQGVLYLADTSVEQGGFQCVPSIYNNLEEWLKTQPEDRDPRHPNLDDHKVEAIPGKAGDFVIWDKLLPHGNGSNYADSPRFAQYISYFPANSNLDQRQSVIDAYHHFQPPAYRQAFPGDPRNWEANTYEKPAELSPLGRKLLGLDAWE